MPGPPQCLSDGRLIPLLARRRPRRRTGPLRCHPRAISRHQVGLYHTRRAVRPLLAQHPQALPAPLQLEARRAAVPRARPPAHPPLPLAVPSRRVRRLRPVRPAPPRRLRRQAPAGARACRAGGAQSSRVRRRSRAIAAHPRRGRRLRGRGEQLPAAQVPPAGRGLAPRDFVARGGGEAEIHRQLRGHQPGLPHHPQHQRHADRVAIARAARLVPHSLPDQHALHRRGARAAEPHGRDARQATRGVRRGERRARARAAGGVEPPRGGRNRSTAWARCALCRCYLGGRAPCPPRRGRRRSRSGGGRISGFSDERRSGGCRRRRAAVRRVAAVE